MTDTPTLRNCGDCNAAPGEMHHYGCDVERCARCGGQSIGCYCIYEVNGMDMSTLEETHPEIYNGGPTDEMNVKWDQEWGHRRLPWTGEFPGKSECREYGFWCIWGPPWIPVPAGTPGASENLNRLSQECDWDVEKQRWVLNVHPVPEDKSLVGVIRTLKKVIAEAETRILEEGDFLEVINTLREAIRETNIKLCMLRVDHISAVMKKPRNWGLPYL